MNYIKWHCILKPLWQTKQGPLSLTSLYCWTCSSIDVFKLIKNSQQNRKDPFIKILAVHCCSYNGNNNTAKFRDRWIRTSKPTTFEKGRVWQFKSLLWSVLDPDRNTNAFKCQAKTKSCFKPTTEGTTHTTCCYTHPANC